MIVTDISIRRKGLVVITLSPPPPQGIEGGEYEGQHLLIDNQIVLRCEIKKGSELNLEDVKQLVFVSECYRAKNRAVWLISGQDYSEKKLYDKLRLKFTPKAAAFAIAQMQKKGYINDEKYAVTLVEKLKAKKMSKRQMAQKLMLDGISKDISDALLKNEDIETTEVIRAALLINSKYKNKLTSEEGIQKTVQALRRRGFSFSDIKKALEDYEEFN